MLDCINKVESTIDHAVSLGVKTIAITDHQSLSSHIRCMQYKKDLDKKGIDINVLLGDEIYLVDDVEHTKETYVGGVTKFPHFILIAKDELGYKQLRQIDTAGWQNSWMTGKLRRTPVEKRNIEDIIGNEKGHLIAQTACFTKGQQVLTKDGLKDIETIKKGELVKTFEGTWERVIKPTSRSYQGTGNIISLNRSTQPITCTENHKFLIKEKTQLCWKEAKDIVKGDNCFTPIPEIQYSQIENLDVSKFLKELEYTKSKYNSYKKNIFNLIHLTPELMRTFGLWLADGHIIYNSSIGKYQIGFTFDIKDFDKFYPWIKQGMSSLGKLNPIINRRPENNRVDLAYNGKELAYIFKKIFGEQTAQTKQIPNQLKNISKEFNQELLYGYLLGDGYFRCRNHNGYISSEIVSASISLKLHEDILSLYKSLGFAPNIMTSKEKIDKNKVHHHKSFYLSLSCKDLCQYLNKDLILSHKELVDLLNKYQFANNHYFVYNGQWYMRQRVKDNVQCNIDEQVYCLQVNNHHNFICNDVIVHNCLGSELAILSLEYLKTGNKLVKKQIHRFITWCVDMFGKENFALEIQPSEQEDQIIYNQFLLTLSEAYDLPIVMTCDVHYLKEEDLSVHSAFLHARDTDRGETESFYKSTWMMPVEKKWELVQDYIDEDTFCTIINNGYNLTKDCQMIDMEHDIIIPARDLSKIGFDVKHIFKEYYHEYKYVEKYAYSKFEQDRFLLSEIENGFLEKQQDFNTENIARIDEELGYIWEVSDQLGDRMSAYYNLVDYIIDLCWEIGFVGISRGSITGFYTMYLTDMQQMNPIKWKLPAWRHLNDQKASMPDVDVDTSARARPKIIEKLNDTFGSDNVLNICTFRTETSKSAVKTACRGLKINDDDADYLASLISVERGKQWTISDMIDGNPKKGRKANRDFIRELDRISNEYNADLKHTISMIEDLISGLSTHASGIYIFKNGYIEQNSLMVTPRGDRVTAWNMDDSDYCGGLKYDSLTTECIDKLEVCVLELLLKYGEIEWQGSIRATYNKYIHPDVLDYDTPEMWDKCSKGQVIDLFQFITPVGGACIRKIKPHNLVELANANSLMRITVASEEQLIDKFVRYKQDISQWYDELREYGITKQNEIKALEEVLLDSYGVANTQEDIMELAMSKDITNFTLLEADKMRKIVGKKLFDQIDGLKDMFFEKAKESGNSSNVVDYVWEQCITPQLAYSFSRNHTTPYSGEALQEMNLHFYYPECFWNCATLTVNADIDEHSKGNTNYGKIAKAIYRSSNFGVPVLPPSINKSDISFTPMKQDNTILFGLAGLSGINYETAKLIIEHRPYTSFTNFLEKNKEQELLPPSKIVTLIKAGCFDEFETDRKKTMTEFITTLVPEKTSLNGQNLQRCIKIGVNLDKKLVRAYKFKQYVLNQHFLYCKDPKFKSKKHYIVEEQYAKPHFEKYYMASLKENKDYYYENDKLIVVDKALEKALQPELDQLKTQLKTPEVIKSFNEKCFKEEYKKRTKNNNTNRWSFDSTSYYHYNQHELDGIDFEKYNIDHFQDLAEQPDFILKHWGKRSWRQFKLGRICGIVVDKDDTKHMVDLLTPDQEVVSIKFNEGQYAYYKQVISETKEEGGSKTIIDESWFKRGTLLMVAGYRLDEDFKAKRYKKSIYQHTVVKIDRVDTNKELILQYEREKNNDEAN